MKKLYQVLGILAIVCMVLPVSAQITVYDNPFPGSGGPIPTPGGTPAAAFGVTTGSSDPTGAAGAYVGGSIGSTIFDDNQLALWVSGPSAPPGPNNGFVEVTAPMSGYAAPFNATLDANVGLVTWTFNMRTSAQATSFNPDGDMVVVILAASNPNVRSAGNGYAVAFNPGMASGGGIQLIKYSGGLTGSVVPVVPGSSFLSNPTNYASVRVTYKPSTDQWILFVRDDGSAGFLDPSIGVTITSGSSIDNTYTGSAMSAFGCYANYSVPYSPTPPPAVKFAYFDNFRVSVTCPEINGGLLTCLGLTTTLSDDNIGGIWTSGSPAIAGVGPTTGVVTGLATGTANITYTNGVCVVHSTVTVNPLPAPGPISGPLTVCMGSTVSLTDGTPGGSWSSGDVTIGTVSSTGVVTGISAGTVAITYSLPGACFARTVVTVNLISPISGVLNMCEGQTATFNDIATGGTWSSTNASVATVDPSTGFVSAVSSGGSSATATISYVTTAGCSAAATVTVNSLPVVATGDPSVCEGFTTTFTSTEPDILLWSASPAIIADVDGASGGTETITGFTAGTSTITYKKLTTGCSRSFVVTVNPAASITSTVTDVCINATITMTGSPSGGSWSSTVPANATVDATSGVVTGIAAGTTVISYVMPTGCFRFVTVNVNPIPDAMGGTLSVCKDETTTLTSGPDAGTWSSSVVANGTVDASGTVTGITPGTTTITYTFDGTGCFNTAEVTINGLPTPITGNTTVCEAATQTLGSTPTGGTWESGSIANATVDATSGVVTGVLAGTADITYNAPSTGCNATVVVTVIPQPAAFTGNLNVCVGLTTTLNTTTSPVTWSSGDLALGTVSSAGVVTGIATGDVPITATGSNGCARTETVTVNPLPANITGGTSAFCAGSSVTLGNTTPGGNWSSNPVSVAFFTSPTSNVLNGSTGIGSTSTATISYTLPTGCRKTIIATVNPLPGFITGTPSVCVGLTTALSSSSGGSWSTAAATTAIGTVNSTGTVTGIAQGTTTISYVLSSTGCFRTKEVTVNPLPSAISGPNTVCPASTITLSSTPTTGTWSNSFPANATVNTTTGEVTGATSGTVTITYTLPTTCLTTKVVTVSPAPIAEITPLGDTALCPGDFVTLTGTTSTGVTYQWFNGPTAIPGATSPTYLTYAAGSYQIKVTITSGCSTMSIPMSVSIVPASASITTPGGTTSGCAGTGVVLNGSTGTGFSYQWLQSGIPIAGATDDSYTAMTSGNYSLIISNSTGCSATSPTEAITINAVPPGVVTLSGPLAICTGTTLTMTADPGLTYQWHNASGAIAGATTASYTTGTAGGYWVVETNTAGCSATSAINNVVVNPLPDVTISHPGGNTVFCTGGSVHLFAVPGPGFNYQWYNGTTAISGATNDNYVTSAAGDYKVKITNPATGCINTTPAPTTVTVVSSPTVTPLTPAKFCWGGSSLLSTSVSSVGSAVNYQWFLNGVAIPGATGSSYTASVPGIYSCTISVPASCVVSTSTIPVVENPLPDPLVTFDGTMFHAQGYFTSYQWYKGTVMIPGATSSSTPATSNGSYKVAVTDTNGCQSMSTYYVLTNWSGSTGVATVNASSVKIYPNPANMLVHVESDVQVRAVITGMDGRQLMNVESAKDIDISKLANGVYMIMIYDNDQHLLKTEKLVKSGE